MTTTRIDSRTLASLNLPKSPQELAARLEKAMKFRMGGGVTPSTPTPESKGISRPTDRVDFSSLDEKLRQLGPLLRGIRAASARKAGASTEAFNAAIERAVQSFAADVDGVYPNGVSGEWDTDLVLGSSVFSKGFGFAESLDIEMNAYGWDDQAGVLLDFGSNVTLAEPASESTFGFGGQLEIAGTLGTTTLSFSSGQTLGQIAAAINAVSGETGATASVQSGSGLVLRSSQIGSDAFVSVEVLDPGSAKQSEIAFYSVRGPEDDAKIDSYGVWLSESSEFTDYGNEMRVSFNGVHAERVGDYWTASLGGVEVAIDLNESFINENNMYFGRFTADLGTLRSSDVREQPDGTVTDFDATFVTDSLLVSPGLQPGETLDLDFAFQDEPDAAGVFLDFGANIVGGYLSQSTTFEIGGPDGSVSLSFISGMTISQIVAAINSQASMTGVQVESFTSGVGITLRSSDSNPGAFVSVTTIPNGDGPSTDDRPVFTAYEVQGSGQNATIVGEGTALADGVAFRDEAKELSATINGQLAQFANGYWSVHLDSGVDITINVDEDAILAAGGSVSLGSISKLQGFLQPDRSDRPIGTVSPRAVGLDRPDVDPKQRLSPPVIPSRPSGPTGPTGPYLPAVPRTLVGGTRFSPPIVPLLPTDPDGVDGVAPPQRRLDLEA